MLHLTIVATSPSAFAFLLLCLLLLLTDLDYCCSIGSTTSVSRHRHVQDQYDPLLVARCKAMCWGKKPNTNNCVKQCITKPKSKPGLCPDSDNGPLSPFDTACVNVCAHDSDCPDVFKCCSNMCGTTCQQAFGLQNVTDLPDVPTNITIVERRRSGNGVVVQWNVNQQQLQKSAEITSSYPVLYVIEERHHVGKHFAPSRLGAWKVRHRGTPKISIVVREVVKPGRWYQFRVAAVSVNGSKGYSEPSMPFVTQNDPREPDPPNNLTVGPLWLQNGSLCGELRWNPPASDLPIQRYKVFWSHRLQGAVTVLNSVVVRHQTVPKDQTWFLLQNLQLNSQYFLQVQALSQFGRDRLKGEKAAIVLNTTNNTDISESATRSVENEPFMKGRKSSKVEDLHLQRIFWSRKRLMARIVWKSTIRGHYTVTWWTGACKGLTRHIDGSATRLQQAATTAATRFDLYDLQFDCRYRVSVGTIGSNPYQEVYISFTTPTCDSIADSSRRDTPQCS